MTTTTPDAMLSTVREELVAMDIENADALTMSTTWQEADVDSIEIIELASALEERYEIEFDNAVLRELRTVGQLVDAAVAKVNDAAA